MKKNIKRFTAFLIITLCFTLLWPLTSAADILPVISDYNNLPEGYQAMGTQNEELTAKGSYSISWQ